MTHFTHIPKIINVNNHGIQAEKDSSEEIQSDFTCDEGALKLLVLIDDSVEKGASTELVDSKCEFSSSFHIPCSFHVPIFYHYPLPTAGIYVNTLLVIKCAGSVPLGSPLPRAILLNLYPK